MTIHEALFTPVCEPLMTVLLLILTTQLILILAYFWDERSSRVRFLNILFFVLAAAVFYMPMLDICWEHDHPDGARVRPAVLAAFGSLSVTVMIIIEILFSLALIIFLRDLVRYKNDHPTFQSVKEAMDMLPVGIAYGKADGTVLFCNLVMNEISHTLTGKGLTDPDTFRTFEASEEGAQLSLSNGSAWHLTYEKLEVEGENCTQLTATDVTEQMAITRELEEKNSKLRDIHMRLDIYNKQADRIIIAQELLTARMAVHNEVGNVLLESRHYLQDPSSFDEEKLLQALKNTNTYLLREYEEDDTARDPLADALETAEAIGVDVAITGIIPAKDPFRMILAAAISECASNTVKHANGDQISVNIQSTDREISYILKSNGEAPALPIRETGGLKSLRALVEKENGTMQTAASPDFKLMVCLPKVC